jgi:hypothetical protein
MKSGPAYASSVKRCVIWPRPGSVAAISERLIPQRFRVYATRRRFGGLRRQSFATMPQTAKLQSRMNHGRNH